MTVKDVEKAKAQHPDALLLVHPECAPAVTALADYAGSTTGIMSYAKKSDAKEFIIGTENSIVQHLQFESRTRNSIRCQRTASVTICTLQISPQYTTAYAAMQEKKSCLTKKSGSAQSVA